MSTVARFRNRELMKTRLTVVWPPKPQEPLFEFEVQLFAQAERNLAQIAGIKMLKDLGGEKPAPDAPQHLHDRYEGEARTAHYCSLSDVVRRHVKDWRYVGDGEDIKFTPANFQFIMDGMSLDEKSLLGLAFELALMEAEAKKEPARGAPPTTDTPTT